MKRLIRAIEQLLWVGGAILLGVWAFAFVHQKVLATLDRANFDTSRAAIEPLRSLESIPRAEVRVAAHLVDPAPQTGQRLALLEIPAIDLEVVVLQGTERSALNRGVGRIEGTAAPGRPGNAGIAGHRDGFFHGLERVKPGDRIRITLSDQAEPIDYRIEWLRVVRPEDVWVLDSTEAPSLTLVTCHPFRYVGPAPDRYVVRAVALQEFASYE